MTTHEEIKSDLKVAMKSGETQKRDTLRSIDSMIKNEEISQGKREEGLDDDEVVKIVKRAIKQRKDSSTQFKNGGREDLAEKEDAEIVFIEKYLPEQMSDDDVRVIVQRVVEESGATKKSDMGKVMGMAMCEVGDKADGNIVRKTVEEFLS